MIMDCINQQFKNTNTKNENTSFKFTIPLKPITKKNHQRILKNFSTGKPFIGQSQQYKDYESSAGWFIPKLGINKPVNVQAVFYMDTKRRVDLVNLQEALLDIMVKYGCITDDGYSIVESMDGSRILFDKNKPRTEVIITLKSTP